MEISRFIDVKKYKLPEYSLIKQENKHGKCGLDKIKVIDFPKIKICRIGV